MLRHVEGSASKPTQERPSLHPPFLPMGTLMREDERDDAPSDPVATGIAGLDDVLGGGFTRNRL
ncbi:MAG TPA: hypothetical protein VHR72_00555, partial [Gemmataceae bacterium]|nr:hypothetical protein [Gemmataceae bacterium]